MAAAARARRRKLRRGEREAREKERERGSELSAACLQENDPIKDRPVPVSFPVISRRTTRTNVLGIPRDSRDQG